MGGSGLAAAEVAGEATPMPGPGTAAGVGGPCYCHYSRSQSAYQRVPCGVFGGWGLLWHFLLASGQCRSDTGILVLIRVLYSYKDQSDSIGDNTASISGSI